MTTPVIILSLLIAPVALFAVVRRPTNRGSFRSAAVFGLSLVFLFTGVGHFIRTESMALMIPPRVPDRELLIYLGGVLEILAALALLVPSFRRATGLFLMAFLVAVLPLNIYAAWEQIPMGGHEWGPVYLLVRVPLQAVLFLWAYWFAVRRGGSRPLQAFPSDP